MTARPNIVNKDISIISAMKLMDRINRKLLFVVEPDNKFVGVLSLGDIQRAIIQKISLEQPILTILRKIITTATTTQSFDEIKNIMLEKRTESMPVIDEYGYLDRIVEWSNITEDLNPKEKQVLGLPVVIMAGGVGSRLKPLTNVIPKPLIPIGEKTIAE